MPAFSVKSGSKCSNRPESFAEVPEATTIDFSCANACPGKKTALLKTAMNASIGFRCESISAPNPTKIALLQDGTFDFSQCLRLPPMSAFGPKQTSASALHMSDFGGKADMPFCAANVR